MDTLTGLGDCAEVSSMQIHRAFVGHALIVTALTLVGCGSDISIPPAQTDSATSERQAQAFIEAMKPRRPGRPTIVILAVNEGTEMTDFLLPHAVLQRADVADVQAVAPSRGRVRLYPALEVEVAQDLATFDRDHPSGADYVIVPAMENDNNPAATGWLKQQADKGARIIGVCAGALVVGNAGLLDGRHFVTHWYYRDTLLEAHPTAMFVPHQRYVFDRDVATTTGITASVPTMLALIEAIAGREKAQAVAVDLGVSSWTPAHDSTQFGLTPVRATHFLLNKAAFWRDEQWHAQVQNGMDDVALALVADAWSRTAHVSIAAAAPGPVKLRSGMTLVAGPAAQGTERMPLAADLKPIQQLDRTLCEIGEHFGDARREWVAMELEYPASLSDVCAP
jgi:transcriptional regulator GlxA family with amidase domain